MAVRKYIRIALFSIILCAVLAVGVWATDLWVLHLGDTHYKAYNPCNGTRACIQAMNAMPGTTWNYGGTIGTPAFAIVCGDITDGGLTEGTYQTRWNGFNYNFPKNGVQGDNNRLKYPVYCVNGNHDHWRYNGSTLGTSNYVSNQIKLRYGGDYTSGEGNNYYSFNNQGIHFCAIGRYPDSTVLNWLEDDLASVGTTTPVILFMHYDLVPATGWWSDDQRQALHSVIEGYRVIAILHSHTHYTQHYSCFGCDIYDPGSAAYNGGVSMLHITNNTVQYLHYIANCSASRTLTDLSGNWTGGTWDWAYSKSY